MANLFFRRTVCMMFKKTLEELQEYYNQCKNTLDGYVSCKAEEKMLKTGISISKYVAKKKFNHEF